MPSPTLDPVSTVGRRHRESKALRWVALGALIMSSSLILKGCASSRLKKFHSPESLPEEIPEEMRGKFDVSTKESSSPEPSSPSPQTQVISEKKASAPPIRPKKIKYPQRRPQKPPMWIGEQQVFDITYFGMLAGQFTLNLLPYKKVGDRQVYHAKGVARSSALFSLFYSIDDSVETFFDYEGLFSHRFHLKLDETKQTRDSLELNDSETQKTFYWNRWHHHRKGYIERKKSYKMKAPFPQDSLSALYYVRTLPLKMGKSYRFPVVSEGKTWEAEMKVIRRETMNTPLGEVKTIVVQPFTRFKGVLKQKGKSYLWFTDDARRWLVRLEAKVKIGSVVAEWVKYRPGKENQP